MKPSINLIEKKGMIKSIDGNRYISVDKNLYKYKSGTNKEILLGEYYVIKGVKSDYLLI